MNRKSGEVLIVAGFVVGFFAVAFAALVISTTGQSSSTLIFEEEDNIEHCCP